MDYIGRFSYVEPSLYLWDEANLVDNFFLMCLWIQFATILLSIFASKFMKKIGL